MNVTVKFFALAKETVGTDQILLDLHDGDTTAELMKRLVEKYPSLVPWMSSLRLAVNLEYVSGDISLKENDEVAVIPPVSGG